MQPQGMAVKLTTYVQELTVLTQAEHDLLKEGHKHWLDVDKFSEDQVLQVKGVFKKVFGIPEDTMLMGVSFPDAIVLQPVGDEHIFYAMVTNEGGEGGWEAMELESEGILEWVTTVPFRLVLALLSTSVCGLTMQTKAV